MLYQQGDVLIEQVQEIPEQAQPLAREDGRYVLAHGEATGHAHAVLEEIGLCEFEGDLYCSSKKPFTVIHEEHRPITAPPGIYRVRRVREYDHFEEEARPVRD